MNTTINKALLSKRKWKPYAVPDAVMEYIKELEEILNSLSSGDRKKDLNGRCEDFDAVNCLSSYYELANYKLFKNAGLVTNFIDAKEGEKSPDIEITFPDNTNLIVECKSVNIFPRKNLLQKMKAFGIISSAYGSERRPKSLHIKNIASKGCHAKSLSGKLTEHFKNDLNKSFISSSLEFTTESSKISYDPKIVGAATSLELPAYNSTDLINKSLKGKKDQLSKINLPLIVSINFNSIDFQVNENFLASLEIPKYLSGLLLTGSRFFPLLHASQSFSLTEDGGWEEISFSGYTKHLENGSLSYGPWNKEFQKIYLIQNPNYKNGDCPIFPRLANSFKDTDIEIEVW